MKKTLAAMLAVLLAASPISVLPAAAAPGQGSADVLHTWYRMILELARHTPTYSPPVASRAFAYLGVTAYSTVATGSDKLETLAGQLPGLSALPERKAGEVYDDAIILHAAMASAARRFFENTGPTGQRALDTIEARLGEQVRDGVDAAVAERSAAFGVAIADHVWDWSLTDGGAVVENMGFPMSYTLGDKPWSWRPTSALRQQQFPLLPDWSKNRTFAMPKADTCALPPPPAYSEEKGSEFYREAEETMLAVKNLTPEQKIIARFWSDDPMLSPTPPGHWIAIATQVLRKEKADLSKSAEVYARVGIAVADGFIGNWQTKYQYDLLRPVTYIQKFIDPKWQPLLITPPFPEYPSGHSTQSGAAEIVLSQAFGDAYAFTDATHEADGLAPRSFPSFRAAADEAGISRLYGGIHFRAAIEKGLEQGRCIGAFAAALKMGK